MPNVRQAGALTLDSSNVRAPVLTLEPFGKNIIQILIQFFIIRLILIIVFLYGKPYLNPIQMPGSIGDTTLYPIEDYNPDRYLGSILDPISFNFRVLLLLIDPYIYTNYINVNSSI